MQVRGPKRAIVAFKVCQIHKVRGGLYAGHTGLDTIAVFFSSSLLAAAPRYATILYEQAATAGEKGLHLCCSSSCMQLQRPTQRNRST